MNYNKNAKVSYMDIDNKFKHDSEVHPDDLQLMCQELYHFELLSVFGLQDKDQVDFSALSDCISSVYETVKDNTEVIEMINRYFFQDEQMTFLTLFSYEMFHKVHKVLCNCL